MAATAARYSIFCICGIGFIWIRVVLTVYSDHLAEGSARNMIYL